jgi:hypothetical protein
VRGLASSLQSKLCIGLGAAALLATAVILPVAVVMHMVSLQSLPRGLRALMLSWAPIYAVTVICLDLLLASYLTIRRVRR